MCVDTRCRDILSQAVAKAKAEAEALRGHMLLNVIPQPGGGSSGTVHHQLSSPIIRSTHHCDINIRQPDLISQSACRISPPLPAMPLPLPSYFAPSTMLSVSIP